MAGLDVMGGAQTGTGKTTAFTLPILNRCAFQAREQIHPRPPPGARGDAGAHARAGNSDRGWSETYAKHTGLRSTVVFGGVDIKGTEAAVSRRRRNLVATPGRLLDHIEQKTAPQSG